MDLERSIHDNDDDQDATSTNQPTKQVGGNLLLNAEELPDPEFEKKQRLVKAKRTLQLIEKTKVFSSKEKKMSVDNS